MKVVVTGATGFIGQHLLPVLQRAGHSLVVVTRNISQAKKKLIDRADGLTHFERVQFTAWNPLNESFPAECLSEADAVIHLMGENIAEGRWTPSRKDQLEKSRVDTTQQLVSVLPDSVRVFLCASAVGIYPNIIKNAYKNANEKKSDSLANFSEAYFPTAEEAQKSFIVSLTRNWELAARLAEKTVPASENGRCSVQLRIGIVLGTEGFLKKMLPIYRLGLGGPIGTGNQVLPWIHISDLVSAIVWATEHVKTNRAINLVGPAPVSFFEISRTIARLCRRPHVLRVPSLALKLALGEQSEIALASCPAYPEFLLENGFSFRFDNHESALADLISSL